MPNTREKLIDIITDYADFLPWETIDGIADSIIADGFTRQQWIPVSERLPERYKNVLTIRTDGKIRFDAIGSLDVWYEEVNYVGYPVTHWMPLPEPPKGE